MNPPVCSVDTSLCSGRRQFIICSIKDGDLWLKHLEGSMFMDNL